MTLGNLSRRLLFAVTWLCSSCISQASESLLLFEEPSDVQASAVQPWVDDYRANMVGPDHFTEYRVVLVNTRVLDQIRYGEVSSVLFNYSDSFSFLMTIRQVKEKSSDWYFSAGSVSDSDSHMTFTVFPNGEIRGSLSSPGTGVFLVTPTGVSPMHLVHLGTGTYDLD